MKKKVGYTQSALSKIFKHRELSREEINTWLFDPKSDIKKISDGYCLTKKIYRKDCGGRIQRHKVFVYYRKIIGEIEVYKIHLGGLNEECRETKRKIKIKRRRRW